MITYDAQYDDAILALRKTLVEHNFDLLVRELKLPLIYFKEPGFVYYGHSIEGLLKRLTRPAELLVRLFGLIQEIDHQDMRTHLFSDEQIDNLISLGLLIEQEGKISTDQYGIIPFLGTYLIATMGSARSIGAYISKNSYLLTTNLFTHPFKSFLDLGSGCGILAILAARRTKGRVVGVDILSEATQVGKVNAVLNKVADRVEFFCGNMYEPVQGEQFDLIAATTPFLALPNQYKDMGAVSSGEDGLCFLDQLIMGLFNHQPKTVKILANGLGSEQAPLLVDLLNKRMLAKQGYRAKLFISSKSYIDKDFNKNSIKLVEGIYQDKGEQLSPAQIEADLLALYKKLKVSCYYGIILEVEQSDSHKELEVIDIANKYNQQMVPNFRGNISLASQSTWLLQREKTQIPLDQDLKRVFDSIKAQIVPEKEHLLDYMNINETLQRVFGIEF